MFNFIDNTGPATEHLHILIIDDDELDQMSIKRSLRKTSLQATVTTADTAAEGLRQLQSAVFDCIFIDFKLPDLNGLELMEKIRCMGVQAPVLVVTSQGDERIAASAIRLGAADYLPKSLLTPEGIYHSIRNAIRLQQAEQQRKLTEIRLQATQSQLEMLISSSPMSFWNTDEQGIITYAKGKAYELLGLAPANLLGLNYRQAFKSFPRILRRFEQAKRGGVVQSVDETAGYYFKSCYAPVFDEAGHLKGITGYAIDITDRMQNERELIRAKEVAEESVRVKELFIANISHEIRTPMNGIVGLTHVMQKTNMDQEQQKYLKAIQTSANNLMHIINDLLDFSKISAQQFTFEQVAFDLRELVQETIDLMEGKALEQRNELSTQLDTRIPAALLGDPLRLRQVLLNLVSNAIKFTQGGFIKLSVHCTEAKHDKVMLEFTVEDTGIGIPADKLQAIFESFTQASNDTTRKYGGTGLGLTISKSLVELQGGTIAVRSQPQAGSTFTFSLPFGLQQPAGEERPPASAPAAVVALPLDTDELSGLKVLLAEDNEINQLLIRTVLEGWGLHLDIVANGLEALERFARQSYDLILMDMQMPKMNGYEAIQRIRETETPQLAHIPIVALTAHATPGEVEKCLAAGADAYVSKPFDPKLLYQTMYRLISRSTAVSDEHPGMAPSFDMEAVLAIAGDSKDFVAEVLAMYMTTPVAVAQIQQQAQAGDITGLQQSLPELYDSVLVITAQPLQHILEHMLEALQTQNLPVLQELAQTAVTTCPGLMQLLQQAYEEVQQGIE